MINVIWNPQLDLGTTTNDDCLNLSFKHLRLIILGREGMVLSWLLKEALIFWSAPL